MTEARGVDAGRFIDDLYVRELELSGFIDSLDAQS
jgi:hypothetical protein